MPNLIHDNSQFGIKAIASQSPNLKTSLPIELQLAHQKKLINPHLNVRIASQIPLQNSKPKFALNTLPMHKSHSRNKFLASLLQKSDTEECEQSEQLNPIELIFDTNSNYYLKFFKLGSKVQNSNNKNTQLKKLAFCPKLNQYSELKK